MSGDPVLVSVDPDVLPMLREMVHTALGQERASVLRNECLAANLPPTLPGVNDDQARDLAQMHAWHLRRVGRLIELSVALADASEYADAVPVRA